MGNRGSLAFSARTNKSLALFVAALFIFSLALFATAAAMPKSALAADGDPVVKQVEAKGCNGVLPTPGSENTNKRLVGGSLVPGGSATFEISYPVSASDVAGRTTFVIDDCVFIDGTAALEYEVSFVPNTENFLLTFTLQIPAGTPIGAEYCNYAKTTAAPSDSPASNRKAGPACFVVGGNITVLKTNEAGDPLAGAHFHVVCTIPTTDAFLPDTIIDGVSHDSTSGGVITQNVVTDETGRIAIQAPVGTSCVITETQAPEGYDIATPDHVTLVASAEGADHTFVDPPAFVPAPAVTIVKSVSATGENGTFVNQLETTIGATVHYRITITNTGNVDLTEVALTDDLFQTAVDNCDVPTTLAVGAHFDCNYTAEAAAGTTKNTATVDTKETPPEDDDATVVVGTGSLKVTKVIPNVPEGFTGSFGVRISCAGLDPVNTTIQFPDPGFVTINDIPAGTVCDVVETSRSDPPAGFDWAGPLFSGTVTIEADKTVTAEITNLLAEQAAATLTVNKTNSAPIIGGVHTAKEGTSVTYTLTFVATGTVNNAVLTDVLPAGVTYTAGSATNGGGFTFVSYDAGTRTLTWTAASLTDTTGSVTYAVTINKGAAKLVQPLTNTATIDSDETTPGTSTSQVYVPPVPLGETGPPTDVAGTTTDGSVSGGSMLFILLALAGLVLTIAFVAPTPAAVRKRR